MGIQRPKRLPRPSVNRPHVQCSTRELELAPGIVVTGAKPRIVARVDTSNAKRRNVFLGLCRSLGIDLETVQMHGEPDANGHYQAVTYDAVGTLAALAKLTEQPFVADWHYAISAVVGNIAGGNGAEKIRPSSPSAFKPKASRSDRTLQDGREAEAFREPNRKADMEAYHYRGGFHAMPTFGIGEGI